MKLRRHLHNLFENELCLVGADSDAALTREVQWLLHALEHTSGLALQDVACTLAHAARGAPVTLAIVASSLPDLCDRLRIALAKLTAGAARIRDKAGMFYFRERLRPECGVAFIFPGEISLYPEMLRDVCLSFDVCREAFDEADAACQNNDDLFRPSDWLFGNGQAGRSETGTEPGVGMAGALLCTHTANTALARLFDALGIKPDAVLGHSGGEVMALEYAGVFGPLAPAERVRMLRECYRLCASLSARTDLPLSALLSVDDPPPDLVARVPELWRSRVLPVMLNGPRQTIMAIPSEGANEIADLWRRLGVRTGRIGLRRFYHSPAFEPATDMIRAFLRRWIRQPPRMPIYSCLSAEPLPENPAALLDACVDQWSRPVRFADAIRKLDADGFHVFVELGARGNLSMHVADVLTGKPHVAAAVNRIHRDGLTQLHHALALLAAHGVSLDATYLHAHRGSRALDLRHPASLRPAQTDRSVRLNHALPELRNFAPRSPLASGEATALATEETPVMLTRANFGADFPMLTQAEVVHEKAGESIELLKTFTTDEYPFIRDYALASHQVSIGQPKLGGLPMLSAITCIEIMAEAARRLIPQKRVVQVDDLRGKRIVTFEKGEARLAIHAARMEWPEPGCIAVRVTLRMSTDNSPFTLPMAEATVFLANLPPERETAKPSPLRNPRPVNWTGQEIYPDRLFQGRRLQTVSHVYQWGDDGLDYEIAVPSRAEAVRDTRIPLFSVWPLMMDGVGSGINLWLAREKYTGSLTLPFRCRNIRFLANVLPEGARLRAYLRITAQTPHSYVADVLVSDGRGRLVLTASGWEELICPLTPTIHRLVQRPAETFLTQELPTSMLGNSEALVRGSMIGNLPQNLLEGQQELWLKAAAFALLNPSERDEWLAMRGAASRRIEWLLGRACVKDAIRRHLLERHQATWAAADILVWTDDSGKPHAHGPWQNQTHEKVDISIAHTSSLVVAAIAINGRIGIDIERIGRDLSEDFSRSVFTSEEHDLAAQSGEGPTALLRFWCAKEALAKALGTGLRYSPSDLRIRRHDAESGQLELEFAGQWLDAFRPLKGRAMAVHEATIEGHILATCVIPAAVLPLP